MSFEKAVEKEDDSLPVRFLQSVRGNIAEDSALKSLLGAHI